MLYADLQSEGDNVTATEQNVQKSDTECPHQVIYEPRHTRLH